jgi:nitrate reductase alpha subunit
MSFPILMRDGNGQTIDGWDWCEVTGSNGTYSIYAVAAGVRVPVGMPYVHEADALERCRRLNMRDGRSRS